MPPRCHAVTRHADTDDTNLTTNVESCSQRLIRSECSIPYLWAVQCTAACILLGAGVVWGCGFQSRERWIGSSDSITLTRCLSWFTPGCLNCAPSSRCMPSSPWLTSQPEGWWVGKFVSDCTCPRASPGLLCSDLLAPLRDIPCESALVLVIQC